jgi:hypothetical protein
MGWVVVLVCSVSIGFPESADSLRQLVTHRNRMGIFRLEHFCGDHPQRSGSDFCPTEEGVLDPVEYIEQEL